MIILDLDALWDLASSLSHGLHGAWLLGIPTGLRKSTDPPSMVMGIGAPSLGDPVRPLSPQLGGYWALLEACGSS